MKNECLEAALRELRQVGIKPTVHRDRRHPLVEWDTPNGRRQYSVSLTPSDWRAPLNTRAEVRRMIRNDGLEGGVKKSTLEKAMELPDPITPPSLDQRIIQLEKDVAELADLYLEQAEKRPLIELRIDGQLMKIEPVEAPATAPTTAISRGGGLISLMVPGEWVRVTELARRYGKTVANVSSTLAYWKKRGAVENKDRKWRRIVR